MVHIDRAEEEEEEGAKWVANLFVGWVTTSALRCVPGGRGCPVEMH